MKIGRALVILLLSVFCAGLVIDYSSPWITSLFGPEKPKQTTVGISRSIPDAASHPRVVDISNDFARELKKLVPVVREAAYWQVTFELACTGNNHVDDKVVTTISRRVENTVSFLSYTRPLADVKPAELGRTLAKFVANYISRAPKAPTGPKRPATPQKVAKASRNFFRGA